MMKARSLQAIEKEVNKHYEEYPKHGTQCSCLDKYIKELRERNMEFPTKTQRAMDYILKMASQ